MEPLFTVIEKHWGFRTLRPLQEQAMRAVLTGRDSLVVLPTGGGKSLCYQAPAVVQGGTTVVVSPLIALMKDQVDGLHACGVPAIQIDSSQTSGERSAYLQDIRRGAIRLVFVSPERLVLTDFCRLLRDANVRTFAIDEAHCISHWGHDFRPEYRQLSRLRELFPDVTVHAYTATATEQVRRDIISQLSLQKPLVLVGNFDRPNLTYRVLPRRDDAKQAMEVIERHPNEGGIIYCISRRDVDDLAAALKKRGVKAEAYHAGLEAEERKRVQNLFIDEEIDVVVATVAFGMGIDRSNIRFVLHARMPKSVEHYQQETGRAGRDGLPAECVLLYSGADPILWRSIVEKSAREAEADPAFLRSALEHLDHMDRYSRGAICRHRALVAYFGQGYEPETCGACDVCLNDTEPVPDAVVVAQKILSCVYRVNQTFGIGHVTSILRGENTENVRKRGHDKLTTYGLLPEASKPELRDWIYQLIGQNVLVQAGDEYPVLKLNEASWEVMRGQRDVRLVQIARGKKLQSAKTEGISWEGVDRELFEVLRGLRREIAEQRGVPPYQVFNDATLRELARVRPSSPERMRNIVGVGEVKLRDLGERFLAAIEEYCVGHSVNRDQGRLLPPKAPPQPPGAKQRARREESFRLFREGMSVADVMARTGLGRSTIVEDLAQFIQEERPDNMTIWVAEDVCERVAAAVEQVGSAYLRPIFVALGEEVPYDDIRLVLACLKAVGGEAETS